MRGASERWRAGAVVPDVDRLLYDGFLGPVTGANRLAAAVAPLLSACERELNRLAGRVARINFRESGAAWSVQVRLNPKRPADPPAQAGRANGDVAPPETDGKSGEQAGGQGPPAAATDAGAGAGSGKLTDGQADDLVYRHLQRLLDQQRRYLQLLQAGKKAEARDLWGKYFTVTAVAAAALGDKAYASRLKKSRHRAWHAFHRSIRQHGEPYPGAADPAGGTSPAAPKASVEWGIFDAEGGE